MGLTWGQLGANLGPTWANLGQLGPIWNQLRPTWANMSQRRPTWVQFGAHTDLKIIGEPLFFLGFSNIFKQSLESFGTALGDSSGTPWGAFGDAWGGLGELWGRLGRPWGDLGDALEALLGEPLGFPWKNLLEKSPRARDLMKRLRQIIF